MSALPWFFVFIDLFYISYLVGMKNYNLHVKVNEVKKNILMSIQYKNYVSCDEENAFFVSSAPCASASYRRYLTWLPCSLFRVLLPDRRFGLSDSV
jgi:hypothetical protein